MKIALLISVFLFTITLIKLINVIIISRKDKVVSRLKSINKKQTITLIKRRKGKRIRINKWLQTFSLFSNFLSKKTLGKIESNLVAAGILMKAEEAVALSVILSLISGILFTLIKGLILGIFSGLLTIVILFLVLIILKNIRLKKMEKQLLDAVVLLANSLRAGQSFIQAMELVSRETPQPLASEFSQVMKETKIGLPIEDSLMNLSKRMENKEIGLLVTGVLIQRQVGGNLAEILDIIANTIEKRIKMRAKINTLTAQGRLSAWIVSLLPILLGAVIYTINPELKDTMLGDPLGRIMLGLGAVMLLLGIVLIRSVVNIRL